MKIDFDFIVPIVAVVATGAIIGIFALRSEMKTTEAVSSCIASGRAPLECRAALK